MGNIFSDSSPSSPTLPFTEEVVEPGFEPEHGNIKRKRKPSRDDGERPDCLGTIVEFLSPKKFPKEDEGVYKAYFTRQQRGALPTMVAFALLCNISVLPLYFIAEDHDALAVMFLFTIANLILFCLTNFKLISDWILDHLMPYIVWFVLASQLYCDLLLYYDPLTPSDGVAWQIFFIFASYTMLPLEVIHIFLLSSLTTLLHCIIIAVFSLGVAQEFIMTQVSFKMALSFYF